MDDRESTRYYWCVNCGHYGDFGKVRKRKLVCEECGYDSITPYSEEEINEDESGRLWMERFKQKKQ